MLAWLITSSLVCGGGDTPSQTIEIAPEVRAVVTTEAPTALIERLAAMGNTALTAAWAVDLGLADDPRGPLDEGAPKIWATLLEGADVAPFLASLEWTLPKEPGYAVLHLAVHRLAQRQSPKVVRVMADLVQQLPAASLQSDRTIVWITDSLLAIARERSDIRDALAENYDRFPAATQSSLDLALLASGSTLRLATWRADKMTERELEHRLRGLARLRPGFAATRHVISVLESLLSHPSGRVRARVAQAIATLGATELVPALVDLTNDDDRRVRRAATASLVDIGGIRWPRSNEEWESWWSAEERWIEGALPGLLDELTSDQPDRRSRALRIILQHPAAAHAIAPGLGQASYSVSDEAFCIRLVQSLAALRGPDATEALRLASLDGREAVQAAARALTPD